MLLPPNAPNPSPPPMVGTHVRRRTRRLAPVALGLIACVLLGIGSAACGTSGRELREPAPGATAPPRRSSTTVSNNNRVAPDDSNVVLRPTGFSLSSPAWPADGAIPMDFGCAGSDTAPPLTIAGVPDGAAELLLIASDVDVRSDTRWIVAGIPITTTAIGQGALPPGAVAIVNSTGSTSWVGPCPDAGSSVTFQLRLYALREPSGLTDSSDSAAVTQAITKATQAAVVRGTYSIPA